MNKKGKFTYPNGDVFEGEWQDNSIKGYGTFTSKNGSTYIGFFSDDL